MEQPKYRPFSKPVPRLDVHCHLGDGIGCFTPAQRLELDRVLGISHCVILPAPINQGSTAALPGVLNTEEAREVCRSHPEHFSWFCNVEPDGTECTYETLARYKAEGAVGVGEFGTLLPFDDPRLDHLLSCCGALGLPFLFHISPYGTNAYGVIDEKGLPGLEGALQRHPDTVFIGHSQPFWYEIGPVDPELPGPALNGFPFGQVEREGRAVELLRKYPNLYADLSANSGSNAILRDPAFGLRFLSEFSDRLLFGTDLLNTELLFPIGQMLDYWLFSKQLSESIYRKICCENAITLLKLPFENRRFAI